MVIEFPRRIAKRHYFGVRGRVNQLDNAARSLAYHLAIENENRAKWRLSLIL